MNTQSFLEQVQKIARTEPGYKLGHDGSDGLCDCIGLIIGAVRRNAVEWKGTHGCNYAVRNMMNNFRKIESVGDLSVGDIVFKAKNPGDSGYALPAKYKNGSDLRDYYHVGVVTHVNPLTITHMTSPTITLDSKLGKWSYYGQLSLLKEDKPMEKIAARVTAESGKTVRLRTAKNAKSNYTNVPVGTDVMVTEKGEEWCAVTWNDKSGYMMTKYLDFTPIIGSEASTSGEINREKLLEIYKELGQLLGV